MINFPNVFSGTNVTLEINFQNVAKDELLSINRVVNDLMRENILETNVEKLYVTFSSMISTINDKETINYHEVIVKVPVVINSKEYIFPIISFVDDECSFLRGTYLGYYKRLLNPGNIYISDDKVELKSSILNIECKYSNKMKNRIAKVDFEKPFVLNKIVGNSQRPVDQSYHTLRISEYKQKYLRKFENIEEAKFVFFKKKYSIQNIWISEDSFILEGLCNLE
ncbi:hypothetical protein [Ligilactobacillus murinus]|uniref:Uncharacterized protein n=1 Tax=Ligilactobacillus murinus TaxID=1622 RepID=A0AAD0L4M3_9LACO|nr:hypothetical protein [Ligilactobacillus murinus]AWZ39070.1 hypothetical protein CPS94_09110 [Ligilactobacillus murinus]AWZ40040.1 hypothetical protein CPQ89_02780 [Ligilactobacillus murinus]